MVTWDRTGKRALVVDDDPVFCFSAAMSLRIAGYEVWEASNGRWALETIETEMKEGRGFDLFVIDLLMPVMGGMELIREMGKIDLVGRVLVVSGSIDPEALKALKTLGCGHWLAKPFSVRGLIDEVRQMQERGV